MKKYYCIYCNDYFNKNHFLKNSDLKNLFKSDCRKYGLYLFKKSRLLKEQNEILYDVENEIFDESQIPDFIFDKIKETPESILIEKEKKNNLYKLICNFRYIDNYGFYNNRLTEITKRIAIGYLNQQSFSKMAILYNLSVERIRQLLLNFIKKNKMYNNDN